MPKKILMVAFEVFPFAKVGGLADVAGALPKALAEKDIDVRVIMPYFGETKEKAEKFGIKPTEHKNIAIPMGCNIENFDIFTAFLPNTNVPVYFISNAKYFDRAGIYIDPATKKDFADQPERLTFFSKAVLAAAPILDFSPDIVHVNDHHTALIPAFLRLEHSNDRFWAQTATVLTIHNLAYQGVFPRESLNVIGLGKELFYPTGPFEFYGNVNFLKIGIIFADAVNTVSPTYAEEIKTEEYGEKLDGLLRELSHKVFGIINGVDYEIWDPRIDKEIEHNYSIDDMSGKNKMKAALLTKMNMPIDMDTPLIGIIGRMADQKGFDLVAAILPQLMKLDVKFAILGTGQPEYEKMFADAAKDYPDKVGAYIGFHNGISHMIEAGSDMFLMPSRFEPCGLNQMYSLRYGTPPIVRKTGGLADTVIDDDLHPGLGTGFVFSDYVPEALLDAIKRALFAYREKARWHYVVSRGMKKDYSWNSSALRYIELYAKARELHK